MSARGANSRWQQLKLWAGVGTLSGAGEEQTSWGSIPLIILPSMRNVDPQFATADWLEHQHQSQPESIRWSLCRTKETISVSNEPWYEQCSRSPQTLMTEVLRAALVFPPKRTLLLVLRHKLVSFP